MKRKIFLAVFPVVLVISAAIAGIGIVKKTTAPKEIIITEFEDLRVIAVAQHEEYQYFVVENPPEDFQQLKDAVEAYILNYDGAPPTISEDVDTYTWFFFRSSRRLNKNWKPNDGYLSEDQIHHHMSETIVCVWWDADDESARYDLYERSDKRSDYGKILRSCTMFGAKPGESSSE